MAIARHEDTHVGAGIPRAGGHFTRGDFDDDIESGCLAHPVRQQLCVRPQAREPLEFAGDGTAALAAAAASAASAATASAVGAK